MSGDIIWVSGGGWGWVEMLLGKWGWVEMIGACCIVQ